MMQRYNYWISFVARAEGGRTFDSAQWVSVDGQPIHTKELVDKVMGAITEQVESDLGVKVNGVVLQCINFIGSEMVKGDEDSAEDETAG